MFGGTIDILFFLRRPPHRNPLSQTLETTKGFVGRPRTASAGKSQVVLGSGRVAGNHNARPPHLAPDAADLCAIQVFDVQVVTPPRVGRLDLNFVRFHKLGKDSRNCAPRRWPSEGSSIRMPIKRDGPKRGRNGAFPECGLQVAKVCTRSAGCVCVAHTYVL